jgi:hypothetical protein
VWFTDEAVAAWAAEPRTTRGGRPGDCQEFGVRAGG